MKRGWWYSASTEDRLAQIDGAIELGMTAKQCAMNCGALTHDDRTGGGTVSKFALEHERHFKGESVNQKAKVVGRQRYNKLRKAKQAYLSGEPVDMWNVE